MSTVDRTTTQERGKPLELGTNNIIKDWKYDKGSRLTIQDKTRDTKRATADLQSFANVVVSECYSDVVRNKGELC